MILYFFIRIVFEVQKKERKKEKEKENYGKKMQK